MTWKPSEDVDREIRQWMKAKGWVVTRTNYDADREVYAWRHDVRGGSSLTLRISRRVLENVVTSWCSARQHCSAASITPQQLAD
jgi:hypothetical protein